MTQPPRALRLPSIDGLRAFEAVARLGSFERAADALDVTAGAIGKRIATVEELLATALFTRGAKALTLTAAGKEYLVQVSAALELLAAVPLHHRAAQRVQRLRIRTPPTFARQILVPQLAEFTAAHPEIELEVMLSIPYLSDGHSDADIEIRNGDPAELGAAPLMVERVHPLASPALLARLAPLREPADLKAAPLLRTPLEPWAPWFVAATLAWPEPAQGPKLIDLGLTLEAAVSGQGIALARPSLARPWLDSGALQPLPFRISALPLNQYCLMPHAGDDAAALFAQWLAQTCTQLAASAEALVSGRA